MECLKYASGRINADSLAVSNAHVKKDNGSPFGKALVMKSRCLHHSYHEANHCDVLANLECSLNMFLLLEFCPTHLKPTNVMGISIPHMIVVLFFLFSRFRPSM